MVTLHLIVVICSSFCWLCRAHLLYTIASTMTIFLRTLLTPSKKMSKFSGTTIITCGQQTGKRKKLTCCFLTWMRLREWNPCPPTVLKFLSDWPRSHTLPWQNWRRSFRLFSIKNLPKVVSRATLNHRSRLDGTLIAWPFCWQSFGPHTVSPLGTFYLERTCLSSDFCIEFLFDEV